MSINSCLVFWVFSLAINRGFGFQLPDIPLEESHFTQSIVHHVIDSNSEFDSTPFEPWKVTVKPTPLVVNPNCACGVHDYVEQVGVKNSDKANSSTTTRGSDDNFQNFQPFVVPGNITAQNQFPFMVALVYRLANGTATHFCGGTLISSKLILTATHCLTGRVAEKTEVWLNERDLLLSTETDHPTVKLRAAKFIPHPEYNPLMAFNDISLIQLSEEVDVSKSHLRPICIPTSEMYEPLADVSTGFTAGWGKTVFDGPKSDHLRHVDVPLIENKACNEESEPFYRGRITTHMICAGDLHKGGRDACPGDSGGPLFIKHKERFLLIGIVSWGDRCSLPRKPGVYTRVSRYIRWINKIDTEMQSTRCTDKNANST